MWKTKSEIMRHVFFLCAIVAAGAMLFKPLNGLFHSPMQQDYHSLIPFIPFISGYLIYLKRKDIYSEKSYSFSTGAAVILIGLVLYVAGHTLWRRSQSERLCISYHFFRLGTISGCFYICLRDSRFSECSLPSFIPYFYDSDSRHYYR